MGVLSQLNGLTRAVGGYTPPGLLLSLASAFVAQQAFLGVYQHEFVGTLLMVALTFSAGKWIGTGSLPGTYLSHAVGVIAADYFGGGPHVNPAVTVAMWALGRCDYTEAYIRIAAQMGGGLVSFPVFRFLSDKLGWNELGGPEFKPMYDVKEDGGTTEAFLSESVATFLLCILVFVLNFEMHFGKFHYIIKQSLTAIGVRILIEALPTAGPAMNPMLGTTWAVFAAGFEQKGNSKLWTNTGSFPSDSEHYLVYWVGPILAAIAASAIYVIYAGGTLFGQKLPLGPFKPTNTTPSAEESKTEDKKDL